MDWSGAREPWKGISRPAVIAWFVFYLAFLAYAFSKHGEFLFIDTANMLVHEGGHALFGWFGPFLLAAYFFHARQPAAFVFCLFFFFENWIYTMALRTLRKSSRPWRLRLFEFLNVKARETLTAKFAKQGS
jgi:hypothetical protein